MNSAAATYKLGDALFLYIRKQIKNCIRKCHLMIIGRKAEQQVILTAN